MCMCEFVRYYDTMQECVYHRKALASRPNGIEANGMNFLKISSRSLNDNNNNNTSDITIFSMLREHNIQHTVTHLCIYALLSVVL